MSMDDSGLGPELFQQPEGDPGNQPPQQEPEPVYSPFAQNYLSRVPEAERGVVGRHIQEWDKGFQQYATGVQQQIKQYKDLGDPNTLKQAHTVYQRLIDDPQSVANWLAEQGYTVAAQQAQQVANAQQQGQPGQPGQEDPLLNHPKFKELVQNNGRMERILGAMYEQQQQREKAAAEAEEDRRLDQFVSGFKKQNPGVPEQYLLAMMHSGMSDPVQIANSWKQLAQQNLNTARAGQVPNIMGASSQPPLSQNAADMTREQRLEALANRLPSLMTE